MVRRFLPIDKFHFIVVSNISNSIFLLERTTGRR